MQLSASSRDQAFEQLKKSVRELLKSWHSRVVTENNEFAQLHLFRVALQQSGGETRRALEIVLQQALVQLETRFEQDAHLLQRSFLTAEMNHRIARDLHIAEATLYRRQNDALTRLTTILQELETVARADDQARLLQRLAPPSYQQLIGVAAQLDNLCDVVGKPGPPWLLALNGIGGIGKTSLADALLRSLVTGHGPCEIGWVTAQREFFNLGGALAQTEQPALSTTSFVDTLLDQLMGDQQPADMSTTDARLQLLQNRLKGEPHLIVIDNLETVADLQALLPLLRHLANPTKFILTSRQNLYAEADIFHCSVAELSQENALALIRQEATQRNLGQILAACDEELLPIVETVGGNPLALRLVVGQTHMHGLTAILADLKAARSEKAENLYDFIYRHAWHHLQEVERRVLLAMPLVAEDGGNLAYLQATSKVEPEKLSTALDQLVALNLVDSIGTLQERRYRIHNLTRTFLHEQVIRWRSDER